MKESITESITESVDRNQRMNNPSHAAHVSAPQKNKKLPIILMAACAALLILAAAAVLYFHFRPLRAVKTEYQIQAADQGQFYTEKKQVCSYAGIVEDGYLYYVQTFNKAPESEGSEPEAVTMVCLTLHPSSGEPDEADGQEQPAKAGETWEKDRTLLKKCLNKRTDNDLYWSELADGSVSVFFPLSFASAVRADEKVPFQGDIRYMVEDEGFAAEGSSRSNETYELDSAELSGSWTYEYSVTPHAIWEDPAEAAEAFSNSAEASETFSNSTEAAEADSNSAGTATELTGTVTVPEGVSDELRGEELRTVRQILNLLGVPCVLGAPTENPQNVLIRTQTDGISEELLCEALNSRAVELYAEYPANGSALSTDPSGLTAEVKENKDGSQTLEICFSDSKELQGLTEHILVSGADNRISLRFRGSDQDILETTFEDIITDGVLRFTAIPGSGMEASSSESWNLPVFAAACLNGEIGTSEGYWIYR